MKTYHTQKQSALVPFTFKSSLQTVPRVYVHKTQVHMLPCLSKSALLFVLNLAKKPVKTVGFNSIYLFWCLFFLPRTKSCHFNSALLKIDCAATIAALQQPHRSRNALPDRNRVQCERLTWVRKNCIFESLSRYFDVTQSSFCAALLQVEHTWCPRPSPMANRHHDVDS